MSDWNAGFKNGVEWAKTHGHRTWTGFWALGKFLKTLVVLAFVALFVGAYMLVMSNAPTAEEALNKGFPNEQVFAQDEESALFVSYKGKGKEICVYPFVRETSWPGKTKVYLELNPDTAKLYFGNDAKVETRKDGDYWTITDPTPQQAWEFVQKHIQGYAESCNLEYLQGKGSNSKKDK